MSLGLSGLQFCVKRIEVLSNMSDEKLILLDLMMFCEAPLVSDEYVLDRVEQAFHINR